MIVVPASGQVRPTRPRIVQPIDENQLATLKGNRHPLARAEFDRGPAPPDLPMERMLLVLKRSAEQEAALTRLLQEQQDKSSANYHKWLTPEEFGEQFGPAPEDVQTVVFWLQSHNFQVARVSRGRGIIEFSGDARQVEQAFHTPIHRYVVNGIAHWANAADPQMPEALAPVVVGVATLHNFEATPQLVIRPDKLTVPWVAPRPPNLTFSNGTHALAPADYGVLYQINPLYSGGINGTGATIGIVGRSNIKLSDVVSFRSVFALPANPPQIILNGPDPGDLGGGEEVEAVLDVSWSGAVAPDATVKFVVSKTTSTTDGVILSEEYIIDNNLADIMSMSFGDCEANYTQAEAFSISAMAEQAAAQGITFAVSAGDTGSAGCDAQSETSATGPFSVNILASSPYDIAVGGTQFNDSGNPSLYWSPTNGSGLGSALSRIPEDVWNQSCSAAQCGSSANIIAGGGGASIYFPKPSWQAGVTGILNDGARDLPDVSLTSSAAYAPYAICLEGSCTPDSHGNISLTLVGGTSAAAPSFAGILGLVRQNANARLGQANYVLYRLAAAETLSQCNSSSTTTTLGSSCIFADVTVGNNAVPGEAGYGTGSALYQATTGYDAASGLGSVNVTNLVQKWSSISFTPTTVTLSISPPTLVAGASAGVSIHVSPTAGSGTPTGDVSLITSTGVGVGFFTLSGGSVSSTTTLLPAGTYTVTAYYAGDATFAASSSAPFSVTVSATSVTLNPTSLSFGSETVLVPSGAQVVKLTNTGAAALSISSITVTGTNPGDFSQTNTCGAGIASGTFCNISVTFDPQATGSRSASVTIADNAAGSPQSTPLSGTGVAGALGVSSLVCTPTTVVSGSASSCTVTLTGAPSSTTAVTLTSSNTSAFTVPATVNVLASQTTATFSATAATVTSNQTSVITASLNSTSAMVTLTAQPAATSTFYLRGNNTEILGTTNGSSVVPTNAPTGFTGSVVVRGTGSVAFSPVVNGDGVVFEGVSSPNTNTAFLSFSGAQVGNVFNVNQGNLTFYVKSSYSFAQRQALGSSNFREVFDVYDSTGELFYFESLTSGGRLIFQYKTGSRSSSGYYYVPVGQEDAVFGLGVVAQFQLKWNGSTNVLYLNGAQVATFAYTPATPNWGAASNFTIGGTGVPLYGGGYYKCDDPIAEFQMAGSGTGSGSPVVSLTSGSLSFANQNVGTTSTAQSVTLNNTGTGALTITNIAVTGANPGDFAQTNTCGSGVAAGGSCSFSVTFTPTATGSRGASISITDNAAGSPHSITLSGTGVGVPIVSLTSTSLSFANQNVGTTSTAQSVTLNNTGTGALTITSIAVAGANPGDFAETNTCGSGVAAGGSCSFSVTFTPTATGSRGASISITDNAAGSPHTITLSGTGIGVPIVSLTSTGLSFANQNVGTTSTAQSVTLNNTGTGALTITSIAVSGANPGDFAQTNTCGSGVAAGGSCSFSVTFTPTATGSRGASISITDNAAGSPHSITLSGTGVGVPIVSLTSTSLSFANQNVGTTSTAQSVTLNNTGTGALTITSIAVTGANPGDFAQTNTCGSGVAAGGSCSFSVTFTPTATGSRGASISITDNAAGSPHTITLSGTGIGVPIVSLTSTGLSFANQNVGTTSTAQSVTLNNTGTGALTITSIAVAGANPGDFAETNTCGSGVAAGGSCSFSVTFTPTATGSRGASISITDNAAGSPHTITLSGTGIGVPIVSLTSTGLSFANQNVGTTSTAQSVTLNNTGTGALTITSIAVSGANPGDFAQTNTCGSGVAAGGSCSFSVTFTPTATGSRGASISITDNAAGSPHSITLSGTGVGVPIVSLTSTSLSFANQNVGTTSTAQSVTLNNTGTATLLISSIALSGANPGDFAQTNTCGSGVLAGGNCSISVTFTPTTTGSRSASLTITDNAASSPQTVTLTGTGQAAGSPTFYLHGNNTEILGTTNGSSVVPTNAPTGFTGSVVVRGTGSVAFSPVVSGDGVVFEGVSSPNTNTAFLSFSGAQVGNVFNVNQGNLTFYVKSSYSFAQRQALGSSNFREVFDVYDSTGELFYFESLTSGGRLIFEYKTGSRTNSGYYYLPVGQEDAMFGLGVVAQFQLKWNGSTNVLYFNGVQVATFAYTPATPNWGATSNFTIGATGVPLYGGGYYKCDDPIAEFQLQ